MAILISCETSGTALPKLAATEAAIAPDENQWRGIDSDSIDHCAGELAGRLASMINMPLIRNPFCNALIDVSRSLHHRQLYGALSQDWSDVQKQQLIDLVHTPYRRRIESALQRILQQFTFVIHLSVRTFDSQVSQTPRRGDIGLLYDPSREAEVDFCLDWIDELYDLYPHLRVRRNYPRRGTVDSLHKALRRKFPADQYLGVEVWLNRAWASRDVALRDEALRHLAASLRETVGVPSSEAA
ncbi:N-formylglutamate amidohydrolase [Stieleria sp. TO1_6]|uniref:N-formylglutamate amidohydrolase n=1 Tax=Stieleria tagensis TaxID=2956795 RepID=UPI00209B8F16|nr:N-formylglutamate amidohydrolase [Stieleria tagensis]MCO8122951.1 N-formylglutamate amidohydrolase [Stieleria tagensis]